MTQRQILSAISFAFLVGIASGTMGTAWFADLRMSQADAALVRATVMQRDAHAALEEVRRQTLDNLGVLRRCNELLEDAVN